VLPRFEILRPAFLIPGHKRYAIREIREYLT
jgi:hypothetical protein